MAYTTIDKPTDYFNTKLYTGNGSTQSITGVGFQPDWVWIKRRNNAADHKLYDVVRGATKVLESSGTSAEGTDANGLTAFNSDGFSLLNTILELIHHQGNSSKCCKSTNCDGEMKKFEILAK